MICKVFVLSVMMVVFETCAQRFIPGQLVEFDDNTVINAIEKYS